MTISKTNDHNDGGSPIQDILNLGYMPMNGLIKSTHASFDGIVQR